MLLNKFLVFKLMQVVFLTENPSTSKYNEECYRKRFTHFTKTMCKLIIQIGI